MSAGAGLPAPERETASLRPAKRAGRRRSSEDDLRLRFHRALNLGDGRGLNPSPDERGTRRPEYDVFAVAHPDELKLANTGLRSGFRESHQTLKAAMCGRLRRRRVAT